MYGCGMQKILMGHAMKKIKAQIVDDSVLVRQVLQEILE